MRVALSHKNHLTLYTLPPDDLHGITVVIDIFPIQWG
ncbi:hypothetical protein SAMN02744783_00475 [Serratia sp. CC22-02]|nr:hypothetical protein SAMN02744783_00475 [Serratia sp. CC22-02]